MSNEIIEVEAKEIEAKETIQIGDKVYNVDDVTPTIYFDYVKGKKKDIKDENLEAVADNCLTLLQKTKLTGQTAAAERIVAQYELIMRELNAASFGFDTIVYKSDIEKFIQKISKNPVKIIELSKYSREVDDSVMDKLMIAKDNELFDEYYVLFTDYCDKEAKKVAKERRDKDPILFGAFKSKDKNNIPEDRFFYIGDWIDEYCDLTLEEMLAQYEKSESAGAKYTIDIPKDVEELKVYMGMLEKKNPEKATLIGKIKNVVEKATSKTTRKPRKTTSKRKKE